jgi:hypothetical protein
MVLGITLRHVRVFPDFMDETSSLNLDPAIETPKLLPRRCAGPVTAMI